MILFPACNYIGFLLRCTSKDRCLSLCIKQTERDTDYRYLPKQKLPGFMELHLHNPTYRNGQAPRDFSSEVNYGAVQKLMMDVIALRQVFL